MIMFAQKKEDVDQVANFALELTCVLGEIKTIENQHVIGSE